METIAKCLKEVFYKGHHITKVEDVFAHVCVVATAIHIAVNNGIVRDVNLGGAYNASHIDEVY